MSLLVPTPSARGLLVVPGSGAGPTRLTTAVPGRRAPGPILAKSKGFGSGTKAPKPARKAASRKGGKVASDKVVGFGRATETAEKIVDQLHDEDPLPESPDVRPIDTDEWRAGRIDRIKVKNWGTGRQEDVGNLEVEEHTQYHMAADAKRPFYEQLAMRLQLHQEKGELVLREARPLPPFERWDYGLPAYLQYLRGQQLVHAALERAVARATAASGGGASAVALDKLGPTRGLQRAAALAADVTRVEALPAAAGAPGPDQMAAAYASYIDGVGAAAAAPGTEGEKARLRLLANVYCVQVAHLTTGVRVGAQAAEKLGLIAQGAVAFYHEYPATVANPIQVLMRAVNEAGLALGDSALLEQAMAELPRAMPKASLLLAPLAVEEGSLN